MQKDIKKSTKGETQPQKEESKQTHKIKEVASDLNAKLKENVGVGFGNYSSEVDRENATEHREKYEEKVSKERFEDNKKQFEKKFVGNVDDQGVVSHKIQEIGHNINANLKENVGFGVGDFPSEVDREKATEHREKYDKKVEEQKEYLSEKKEELKENVESGSTGIYAHKLQEVGHNINATLKENVGIGLGDYSSEVDREKASEHREKYDEKVKEETKPEVGEATSLGHKIREVAHTVNANLKEMIGIGVGNYSSEVDRELANIHHEKYEEMTHINQPGEDIQELKEEKKEELQLKKDEKKEEQQLKKDEKKEEQQLKKDEKKEQRQVKKDEKEKEFRSKEAKDPFNSKSGSGDNKL